MNNLNKNNRKKQILRKCKKIKLVITDVDCVLTDGGMYYTDAGDIMKKFHTRDGMGVKLLRDKKIPTVLVTKEKTGIVKQWTKMMKVKKLYDGIIQKELILSKVCRNFKIKKDEVAFIGDDVNDLNLMKQVGFSATPRDGIQEAKKIADYICRLRGGEGVLREIADLIINSRLTYHKKNYY